MHTRSDDIEIMVNDEADEVIEKKIQSLFSKYQYELGTLMKGRDYIIDSFHLLYYKYHKIIPNCGGAYIDSSD